MKNKILKGLMSLNKIFWKNIICDNVKSHKRLCLRTLCTKYNFRTTREGVRLAPPGIFLWRRGVVVITTAQLHSTKPKLRFCKGSNPASGVSEIRDGEDL